MSGSSVTLAVKVALVVVLALVLFVVALRLRKLRRDDRRERLHHLDQRLVKPPPSPYTPSKGFRLLDGEVGPTVRAEPSRPRLEPAEEYVFGDAPMAPLDAAALARARHDTQWALSRSAHRSGSTMSGIGVATLVVIVAGAVVALGYYAHRHHPSATTTTTTTTPRRSTTTTTPAWPASFSAASVGSEGASYSVPAASYEVTVSGLHGPVWAIYRMGPANTLEFQGDVAQGASESLRMTGVSRITLGSPGSATVSVGGSPVVFPSPLTAPLTLIFTPSAATG